MAHNTFSRYTSKLNDSEFVAVEDVKKVEDILGIKFPKDYVEFITQHNKAHGLIGENAYLILWDIDQLPTINEEYEVQQYAPGLILFGTDGGGLGYAFDTRNNVMSIVEVGLIGLSLKDLVVLANTFSGFLRYLYLL